MSSVPEDRTLAQEVSGALRLFGPIVAGAFLATAVAYAVSWGWLTPQLERSRSAVTAERASFVAMLDQETGLRAYVLTSDLVYLEPYRRGQVALAEANRALLANVEPTPELSAAMVGTLLAQEGWRARWGDLVARGQLERVAPQMPAGKQLFDAYREKRAAFADGLLRYTADLSRRDQIVVAVRVALELLTFAALLLLAMRQRRALRDAIVTPFATLLLRIRRIRDGQLDACVALPGAREFTELADDLNEMIRALAVARASAESRDEALRRHSARLRQILDASREFSESLNLKYVVGAVRDSTAAVGDYERVTVWLMDHEHERLVNSDLSSSVVQNVAARAAKAGRISFEGINGNIRFSDSDNTGMVCAIAIPLIVGARVVGALEARHARPQLATREGIEVLEMLATHAATAIESARLHEVLEERSQMDALTHLLNRRRLEEDLDTECKRCLRYGRPLAFVMLDVDNFKAFNDVHGHPRADTVLQEVAGVLSGCARTTDTAYRYGGEEFCILLRETSALDAMHLAERVRARIEQRFASNGITGITASFGVAEFSANAPAPHVLVEAADAAMYESKHAGRNRATLSSSAPPAAVLAGSHAAPSAT